MNELIFVLMLFIKESMETIAIKRHQINLPSVRCLLILSCLLTLHLVWRGILGDWPQFIQLVFKVSLISDIVILINKN